MAEKLPELRGAGKYLRVGSDMVAATFVGAAIGYLLDRWLNTSPWMLIIWFVLGVVAGFISVYRRTMADVNQKPPEKRP